MFEDGAAGGTVMLTVRPWPQFKHPTERRSEQRAADPPQSRPQQHGLWDHLNPKERKFNVLKVSAGNRPDNMMMS